MIRGEWSLINFLTCFGVVLVLLIPLLPFAISVLASGFISPFVELYQAVIISGVISAVLTVIFYKMAVGNAKELITKAEV
jgi:uncharacterized MnhB-related membrane protein